MAGRRRSRRDQARTGMGGAVSWVPKVATGFSETIMAARTGQRTLKKVISVSGCRLKLPAAARAPISAQGPAWNIRY